MGFIINILLSIALFYGGYWVFNEFPQIRQMAQDHLPKEWSGEEMIALEARFSEKQLSEKLQGSIPTGDIATTSTTREYHPHLLMEVKFVKGPSETGEGILLWSLEDGEMVLRTGKWTTTHGFADCLDCGASRDDLRILNALAKRGGRLDRNAILKEIHADPEQIDNWLESCRHKQLIVQQGNNYRIHLQDPVWTFQPTTNIDIPLVQRGLARGSRVAKRYTAGQIEGMAQFVFGTDFAVRSKKEVYLPIYLIEVHNEDGSKKSMRWNAFSGEPFKG